MTTLDDSLHRSSLVGNDLNSDDENEDMKLDPSSLIAAAFMKNMDRQEVRPALEPCVEKDLHKSCALLVQSTKSSKSGQKGQVRKGGALPVLDPQNRVRPAGAVRGHKSTSEYVPPRQPAPAKEDPPPRRGKSLNIGIGRRAAISDSKSLEEDAVSTKESDTLSMEKLSPKDRKPSDAGKSISSSGGEEGEKQRKGVKKLVVNMSHAVTGYIRPHDLISPQATSPPLRRKSSVKPSETSIATVIVATEVDTRTSAKTAKASGLARSPSTKPGAEEVKFAAQKHGGVTYVEALPPHLLASKNLNTLPEENTRVARMKSEPAMKTTANFATVDRLTTEPLPATTSKDDSKKHRRVSKAMRSYVKPPPIDLTDTSTIDEVISPSSKVPKTPKSAMKPTKAPNPTKVTTEPPSTSSSNNSKESKKSPVEAPKLKPAGSHNPLRIIHDYVKPTMANPHTIQTGASNEVPGADLRKLSPKASLPSMSYVPPKIRTRGRTLPSSTEVPFSAEADPMPKTGANIGGRSGPIFGGGYPVNQESGDAGVARDNKENKSPTSPGMFGRNPGGSGFRIHFSHFLHKQRSDGYDQLA